MSNQPLYILRYERYLMDAKQALEDANFEVFAVDETKNHLYLSACLNSDTGSWVLAAVKGERHVSLSSLIRRSGVGILLVLG